MEVLLKRITSTLSKLRIPVVIEEFQIHDLIAEILKKEGFKFRCEYKLGPRSRIDFFIEDCVGLEVKKRRPNQAAVINQLNRYAASDKIKAIILAIERYMDLPKKVNGKPCISIGLNKLWGVSI